MSRCFFFFLKSPVAVRRVTLENVLHWVTYILILQHVGHPKGTVQVGRIIIYCVGGFPRVVTGEKNSPTVAHA